MASKTSVKVLAPTRRKWAFSFEQACPMNILLVHQYALPPSSAGGTRHFALARRLVRMGHAVTVVASRYSYSGTQTVSDVNEETLDGVRSIWLDSGQRGGRVMPRGLV